MSHIYFVYTYNKLWKYSNEPQLEGTPISDAVNGNTVFYTWTLEPSSTNAAYESLPKIYTGKDRNGVTQSGTIIR